MGETTNFNNCSDVVNLSLIVDEDNVIEGSKAIVSQIRQHWILENIKFKLFTDGITNKLVGCFYHQVNENNNKNGEEVLLIRVYGNKTDLLIDRDAEKKNIILLHNYGYAPKLYATFKNGLVYEYVPGVTLTEKTVVQPDIWRLIAKRMAQMHKNVNVDYNTTKEPMLFKTVKKFLNLIPEEFSDPLKHSRVKKLFPSIQELRDEFSYLYEILKNLNSPCVFCHNDLLLGNVIYTEQLKKVTFIDYEYADYNYQAFDIGNHFAEFAGVIDVDYSKYPNKEFQMNWLQTYLEEFNGRDVSECEVETIYKQVNKFTLASHFIWMLWGLYQLEFSLIDYDFCMFAEGRYKEYLAKREQFLAL